MRATNIAPITAIIPVGMVFLSPFAGNTLIGPILAQDEATPTQSACYPRNDDAVHCRQFIELLEGLANRSKEQEFALAEAYTDLATIVDDPAERTEALQRKNQLFRKLVEAYPNDTEILAKYAYTHEDDEITVALLRKLVEFDPNEFAAHWILGDILVATGKPNDLEDGLKHLESAYRHAEGTWKIGMAGELISVLEKNNAAKQATEIKDRLQSDLGFGQRLSEAESVVRSSNPLSQKVETLRGLAKTLCHPKLLRFEKDFCSQLVTLARLLKADDPTNALVLELFIDTYEQLHGNAYASGDSFDSELRHAYEVLLAEKPEDMELLFRYSQHLAGEERIEYLGQTASLGYHLAPEIYAALAQSLVEAGRKPEAIEFLRKAFAKAFADSNATLHQVYGEQLVQLLRDEGQEAEAERINRMLRR